MDSECIQKCSLLYNPNMKSLMFKIDDSYYTSGLKYIENPDTEDYTLITTFSVLGEEMGIHLQDIVSNPIFIKTDGKESKWIIMAYVKEKKEKPMKLKLLDSSFYEKGKKDYSYLNELFCDEIIEFVGTFCILNPCGKGVFKPYYPAVINSPFPERLFNDLQLLAENRRSIGSMLKSVYTFLKVIDPKFKLEM